ncbi:31211_t:CDS:2, partial [Gigaspora margarita]
MNLLVSVIDDLLENRLCDIQKLLDQRIKGKTIKESAYEIGIKFSNSELNVVKNKYDEFYLVDLNTEEELYYALDKSTLLSRFKKQPTNEGALRYCFSMDDSIGSSAYKRINGKTLKDFLIELGELEKNAENIPLEINNALDYIIGACNVEKEFDIGTTLSQIAIALNAREHTYDKFKAPLYDMHLSDFLENIQPELSLLFYPVTEPPSMNFRLKNIRISSNNVPEISVDLANSDDSEFIIQELSINLWAKNLKLGSLTIERNITNSVMWKFSIEGYVDILAAIVNFGNEKHKMQATLVPTQSKTLKGNGGFAAKN